MRRLLRPPLRALLAVAAMVATGHALASSCAWPDWEHFKQNTLSADGRVIDASTPQQVTVSEGQAYALFFALVANDRATFDRVLNWTQNNLAQGDLTQHLPAWQWGRQEAKDSNKGTAPTWGVLDSNPASDADLWIAYTLIEAGRLWHERSYTALGTVLARNIAARETAVLPGLGRTVLPGPVGFHPQDDVWRLNPSYVPLQVMRQLAHALPQQTEWKAVLDSSTKLVTDTAPHGFSPDWVIYRRDKGFGPAAGPRATELLEAALRAEGYDVRSAVSPWRLGRGDAALMRELAHGTAAAVRETGTVAESTIRDWLDARLGAAAYEIGHRDFLALPPR